MADPERMRQLFANLFENCIRYSHAGGRVALHARHDGATLAICVDDGAPAVPDEALAKLGQRFYRVDASRSRALGGAGLGPGACAAASPRRMADNSDFAHSPLGGLRVRLSLPLGAGMSARLFIVEDEPELAALVADYARAAGYAPVVFGDGAEALAAVRADAPELLVLDLMLPGLDGLAVCRAVRAFSEVPIVMVTARVEEIDRLLGLEARRRRLPVQTVQPARADGAHQGDPAARRQRARRCGRSASTKPASASASTAASST